MAEEVEVLVAGMVEASVVAAAMVEALVAGMVEASAVAAAISPVAVVISVPVAVSAVAISLGLPGVVLVAIALRNTEEGISSTGIASSTEIISGTITISFLEVPFCMITPTMGMIIRTTGIIIRTGTTDIRTTDIMGTTAFAVNRQAVPS